MLRELCSQPARAFTQNPAILSALYEAITSNLFYNAEEYVRTLSDTYDMQFYPPEDVSGLVVEPALETIILPVHTLLWSMLRRYKSTMDAAEKQLLRSTFPPSLLHQLVPLLETPIEEEAQSLEAILCYIGENLDEAYQQELIAALDWFATRVVREERPLRGIDHVLAVALSLSVPCSRSVALRPAFDDFAGRTLAALHAHPHFVLVADEYRQFLLYYLRFFHLRPGRDVQRSPFDAMFPSESPFVDDALVRSLRSSLLLRFRFHQGHYDDDSHNQPALVAVLLYLCQHQFYPRRWLPRIFRVLVAVAGEAVDASVIGALVALISAQEIFAHVDATRREILHLLWTTESLFSPLCGQSAASASASADDDDDADADDDDGQVAKERL